jgi:hypothetical protein
VRCCCCRRVCRAGARTCVPVHGSSSRPSRPAAAAAAAAAAVVSHFCACIGSPCLKQRVHGDPIAGGGGGGAGLANERSQPGRVCGSTLAHSAGWRTQTQCPPRRVLALRPSRPPAADAHTVVRCGAVVRGAQLLLLLLLCREWTDVAAFAPHSCVVPRTWGCLRGRAGRTRRSSHGSWAARSGACGKRRREPCPKPATTGQASRRPRCGSRGRGSDVLVTVTSAHRLSLPEATPTC